jgi:MFS family permease
MLALLATAELAGMSLWFAGSAVAPLLAERWALSGAEIGGLTTAVQLGFVVGTALSAMLNLADVLPGRVLFAVAALIGAGANALLAGVDSYAVALLTRFAVGLSLAGVYPPAMKMAATWFRARRGFAVGTVVGALTIGKATPYLVQSLGAATVSGVVVTASLAAVAAAALVWFGYRDGPYPFARRPFSWGLVGEVVRERRYRLATGGYLGHMAELYSYWTWIPAFIAASAAAHAARMGDGSAVPASGGAVALLAFAVIAVGGIGCVWGGIAGDRIGREKLVSIAMAASGACALLIGLAFGQSWWVLAPIALVWGFFVVADSAQFSVLVTESVPAHAVGTALTLQVSLGFLLTTATIQLVPPIVSAVGWQWAFPALAIGPVLGIWCIQRLQRLNRSAAS